MSNFIKMILGTSWMTTVLGWIASALGVSVAGWTKPDGTINWVAVGMGILVAAFARMTKQTNVTGGTTPSTAEAAVRLEQPIGDLPGAVPEAFSPGEKGPKGAPGETGDRGPRGYKA